MKTTLHKSQLPKYWARFFSLCFTQSHISSNLFYPKHSGWIAGVLFVLAFTSLRHQALAQVQVPTIQWQKLIGGTGDDVGYSIEQTADGGYITVGYSNSSNTGDVGTNHGSYDYWVIKYTALGAIQWQKLLGGAGDDKASNVKQTADGGYIVVGYSSSNNTGDVGANHGGYDMWVVKLDALGVIQWQKLFGGTGDEFGYGIEQTADGGYFVGGATDSSNSGDVTSTNRGLLDVWFFKLNAVGVVQWQKTLGGTSHDGIYDLQKTTDGGYILAGYSVVGSTANYWIAKIDASGTVQWEKTFGGSDNDKGQAVQQTADGGYILAGFTRSSNSGDVGTNHGVYDCWIIRLDAAGTVLWKKLLGGNGTELALSIQKTTDGGFIMGGYTDSFNTGDVGASHGNNDSWVVKLDALGAIQWQKTLGGNANETCWAIRQTTDGGFIVAGYSDSSNSGDVTGSNHGTADLWIVKLLPPCPFIPSVSGNGFIYKGETSNLTGSATTGTAVWSSDNPNIATVSQTGVVTGVNSGTTTINYTVTEGTCTAVVSKGVKIIFFDPAKCYSIANKITGKVLAVKDASPLDSAQIYQWSFDSRTDKLWKVVKLADGKYNFISVGSGKVMDIQDNTPAGFCTEGTIIQQFTADGTNSQKWRLELQQTDGSFKIVNETCNKFLRVEGPSSADGANVGIKNDFGTDAFKWFIEEMPCVPPFFPGNCYRILNKATNKVLEVKNASLADSAQIYQWASDANRLQQVWRIESLADGKYTLRSVSSNKMMDILDNTPAGFCVEGTIIQQFPYDFTDSQKWSLILQADGSYKILNATCNKYLRVESASTANGANVGIKNDFGSDAFKWYFQLANCSTGTPLSATNASFGFEARASEGRAKLQWVTNTSDKTDYFEIERLNPKGDFEVLGRQNTEGGSDLKSYTFTDNSPLDGDNYYRINTVFQNAPPQYSELKKVSFAKNDGVNIYPNPANDYIALDLRKYEGKTVSLYLYNSMGIMVKKQVIEKVSAAPQQVDIQEVSTGSYLMRVQSEGKRDVLRQVAIAK